MSLRLKKERPPVCWTSVSKLMHLCCAHGRRVDLVDDCAGVEQGVADALDGALHLCGGGAVGRSEIHAGEPVANPDQFDTTGRFLIGGGDLPERVQGDAEARLVVVAEEGRRNPGRFLMQSALDAVAIAGVGDQDTEAIVVHDDEHCRLQQDLGQRRDVLLDLGLGEVLFFDGVVQRVEDEDGPGAAGRIVR
jgi:hypothetical protein